MTAPLTDVSQLTASRTGSIRSGVHRGHEDRQEIPHAMVGNVVRHDVLSWSPSAHKFLMEVPEVKLAPAGCGAGIASSEEMFESTMVVYLVDMDRQ